MKRKNNEEKEKNWLYQLSKNNEHLKLSKLIREESDQQLIIFGDNPIDNKAIITQTQLDIELEERYDRFYILSYEIDNNNLIDDASLLMLDPRTLELAEIETLRPLVVKYQSLIDRELLLKANEAITPEEFSGVTAEYSIHQAEEDLPASPADYPIEESQAEDEIKDI